MKHYQVEVNTKYAKFQSTVQDHFEVSASNISIAAHKASGRIGDRESGRATWMQVTLREVA